MLSKDQIRAAEDLKTEDVEVPEWGGIVRVRTMTGRQRDRFNERLAAIREKNQGKLLVRDLRVPVIIAAAVDANGDPLLGQDDANWLDTKAADPLDRVAAAALRVNGMGAEQEELRKNS